MRKIRALELDVTVIRDTFTAFADGIYFKKMSITEPERANSPAATIIGFHWDEGQPITQIDIGSLKVGNSIYTSLNSLSDLYLFDESFYYDFGNQTLYIALPDYRFPLDLDVFKTGETTGFLSEAQFAEINGVKYPIDILLGTSYYEPRLLTSEIIEEVDDQQNGLFIYEQMTASFNNADGKYDKLRKDVVGNQARLYIADLSDSPEEEIQTGFPFKNKAEPEDFTLVRAGIIEDVDYTDPDTPTITAIDVRADWTQKIGENLLTISEFPDLPDKYIDARKPVCIGTINGVSGIPLQNTNDVAGSFSWLFCDTAHGAIQSITDIYFKGQLSVAGDKIDIDRYLTVEEYSIDLNTGIITVSNCYKGEIYAYGKFTGMSESVEIILYLLNKYAGYPYISTFFEIDEIEKIRLANYQTHVYIDEKGKKLNKIIEQLVLEIQCDMYQVEGKLTMRLSNEQRAKTEAIDISDLINTPVPWRNDRGTTIKTIEILYNQDYREKLFDRYYDDSNEGQAILNNRKAEDKTIEVNLTNGAQVQSIYSVYYSRFVKLPRTITIDLKKAFIAGVTDFIEMPVIRRSNGVQVQVATDKEIFPLALYKIEKINRATNSAEASWFSDVESIVSAAALSGDGLSYDGLSGA